MQNCKVSLAVSVRVSAESNLANQVEIKLSNETNVTSGETRVVPSTRIQLGSGSLYEL